MTLWQLNENELVIIDSIETDLKSEYLKRLNEIGFAKGEEVLCLKSLPFNGPKIYQVSDTVFSLEKELATKVQVTRV
ncbi:MAG: ferrous iron transport protein A [Bacteriovoracaceae bacterium]|nr:ferrous iron transport protein A [Bacteriovoracaceae bacterium]